MQHTIAWARPTWPDVVRWQTFSSTILINIELNRTKDFVSSVLCKSIHRVTFVKKQREKNLRRIFRLPIGFII